MSLTTDIQTLEPGSEIVLFEVDGSEFEADILRFQSHIEPYSEEEIQTALTTGEALTPKAIIWQGERYYSWPCQITGLNATSDGSPSSPTLSVANVDGSITALCLVYQDMSQAKVTIRRTLSKYLDAENFPNGNDQADPEQEHVEIWYIRRKISEDKTAVTFELSSPADVGGIKIGRKMTAYCQWCLKGQYRGADCGYSGSDLFTDNDEPTDDPAKDKCSGTLTGCALRFGENNQLPHGGFPAVRLIRK
ncbi:phage minor tail protein L [Vibrio cincinnatiensis]|uniref:phage minor tail protein L n=1 Tax=Vibrio cincinnatiensis TaxID=675 RepID=UPI001EE139A8|nr:phage minor tail protein L [Vibrio cincinnatiensis]MCG3743080.1 phage minor tail protein L [Vibrio cincinnatiensis]